MKKRGLIIAIIIFAIITIAIIIFVLFPHSQPVVPASPMDHSNPFASAIDTGAANTVVSPDTFTVNFYKWYIGNYQSQVGFPTTQQLATTFTQWATPAFILKYQSDRSNVDFGVDPVLYSQDLPDGWRLGLTAKILSQTPTSSSVQFQLGTGSLAQIYYVQLVKGNGQWLIDSITSP